MSADQKDAIWVSRRKKIENGVEALVVVLQVVKSTSDAFDCPIGPVIDGLLKLCKTFQVSRFAIICARLTVTSLTVCSHRKCARTRTRY